MKITSKDLFAQVKKQHETTLAAAFKSGNPEQMAEAMTAFFDGMNEAVLQKAAEEIDARNQDAAILSARGANVLTADERAYYEGLAAALKASDPRAAVANYEVAMPQTVIERIIGTIKKTHPLLDKLKPFVLHNGEVVTVTTSLSNMHIMLASRGVQTEITNKAVWPVAWLKLHPGENLFRYGAASGEQSLQVQIWHRQSYGGA